MPGISTSRTTIPLGHRGGQNWSSFWATLISATVENAAPTHVVLTFPAPFDADETDFTIPGFTFASASWTGPVLTLILSSPVLFYHGNLTITFVTTGGTAVVTNNVAIANTVGWYAMGDGSATYVTKDGSDLVSVWKDLSGAGNDLLQATGTKQPLWRATGILFDGIDNFLKAAPFVYDQPCFLYLVVKEIVWGGYKYFFDGNTPNSIQLRGGNASPIIYANAGGGAAINNYDLVVGELSIIRVLFSGAASKVIVDAHGPVTADIGTNAMSGFTLCARGDGNYGWGNYQYKEIILRNVSDGAATETAIYNYLANKYGMTPI